MAAALVATAALVPAALMTVPVLLLVALVAFVPWLFSLCFQLLPPPC